jgi:hypothetical protein
VHFIALPAGFITFRIHFCAISHAFGKSDNIAFIVIPNNCFSSLVGSFTRCTPFFGRPRLFADNCSFVGFLRGFSRAFMAVESLEI